MAPSERHIVSAVLGLLSGFAVTWYLLWWRRRGPPPELSDDGDDDSTHNAVSADDEQSVSIIRERALSDAARSFLESYSSEPPEVPDNLSQNAGFAEHEQLIIPELADASQSLLASQTSITAKRLLECCAGEGSMTVSQSWAILNGSSGTSSPRLSPVPSAGDHTEHVSDTQDDIETDSLLVEAESGGDDTGVRPPLTDAEDIVLEAPSHTEDTVVLSTSELQFSLLDDAAVQFHSMEHVTLQYDELLKEHKETTEAHNITRDEITAAIAAAQTPEVGLSDRHAEVLVWLILHDNPPLKQAAVQGIARCATFTNNQVGFVCWLYICATFTNNQVGLMCWLYVMDYINMECIEFLTCLAFDRVTLLSNPIWIYCFC